ncbi:MAG: hypothetical protein PHG02_07645 [Oscillospiraceae bacterium]|nr:hypothetical protein [Oscillospiraceae bacterium]
MDFYKTMGYVYTDMIESVMISGRTTFAQDTLNETAIKILDEIVKNSEENTG